MASWNVYKLGEGKRGYSLLHVVLLLLSSLFVGFDGCHVRMLVCVITVIVVVDAVVAVAQTFKLWLQVPLRIQ